MTSGVFSALGPLDASATGSGGAAVAGSLGGTDGVTIADVAAGADCAAGTGGVMTAAFAGPDFMPLCAGAVEAINAARCGAGLAGFAGRWLSDEKTVRIFCNS